MDYNDYDSFCSQTPNEEALNKYIIRNVKLGGRPMNCEREKTYDPKSGNNHFTCNITLYHENDDNKPENDITSILYPQEIEGWASDPTPITIELEYGYYRYATKLIKILEEE